MCKKTTWYREPLDVGLKLAITLRFLATGDHYKSLMYLFYVASNTISLVVRDVTKAICEEYAEETVGNPTTPEGWKEVAKKYATRWNFHHAIGALDGKHIRLKAPAHAGSLYFNYKHYNSIVLLALVDADYKFLWVHIGAPGSQSDAHIWNECSLKQALEDGTLGMPEAEPLPNDTEDMPYFIIGDNAFALRQWMMKPFAAKPLSYKERIFNYRLSRARRCVENAFGILANRFGCLLRAMRPVPETTESCVMACVCLHNMLRTWAPGEQNAMMDREDDRGNLIPGAWRDDPVLDDIDRRLFGNQASRAAKRQRLELMHYYNSPAGSVPWQDRMIE